LTDPTDRDRSVNQPGDGWSTGGAGYFNDQDGLQRVFVVHPYLKGERATDLRRTPEARLEEAMSLAVAIEIELIGGETISLRAIKPSTYLGKGKLQDLKDLAHDQEIDLIVFDCDLSPIQQRNLERDIGIKVIDRTALILEIFGARASTKEGELQVELAHLVYQRSRLVRSWTHLERQRGGSGFMGGPGETQIESDRRIIADRIVRIKRQLESVARTRTLHRKNRQKTPYPIVALVGYTNAGKSTLFNRLTGADVMAEDVLFATLDPTLRGLDLPSGRKIILSDTVGFISELPTMLIAAFRATLEEVLEADVIIHVRDANHPDHEIQKNDVLTVLEELGVELDANNSATPIIDAMNKSDLVSEEALESMEVYAERNSDCMPISGVSGYGCERLVRTIDDVLGQKDHILEKLIPYADGAVQSWIHANTKILSEDHGAEGVTFKFIVDPIIWAKFEKRDR